MFSYIIITPTEPAYAHARDPVIVISIYTTPQNAIYNPSPSPICRVEKLFPTGNFGILACYAMCAYSGRYIWVVNTVESGIIRYTGQGIAGAETLEKLLRQWNTCDPSI